MMTERQRTAYAYPCWRAAETIDPRFFRLANGMSTILSVNR
jgi:hypothetical protein